MTYVQLLRIRKSFVIFGIIIGTLLLLGIVTSHWPGAEIDTGSGPHKIPLSGLLFFSAYCGIAFATAIGTSLNRENDGVEMVWTKPISRERLAFLYVLCDVAAIVVATALALAAVFIGMASVGFLKYLYVDPNALKVATLGLGVAFMWYGMLQALSFWQKGGRGGMMIGISWGAAFILMAFAAGTRGNPALHGLFTFINIFNPLAYFGGYGVSSHSSSGQILSLVPIDTWARAALTVGFGVVFSAIAILGWKRVEA
jgi:hypothetical protein